MASHLEPQLFDESYTDILHKNTLANRAIWDWSFLLLDFCFCVRSIIEFLTVFSLVYECLVTDLCFLYIFVYVFKSIIYLNSTNIDWENCI